MESVTSVSASRVIRRARRRDRRPTSCESLERRLMLSSGPVDWYKFDEGSGIVTADSAGANPGTLVGVPPPQWIAGHTGPFALSFGGNGAFGQDGQSSVDVANSLAPVLGGTATLTAWIWTTQTGADPSYNAPAITGVEQQGLQNDIRWGYLDPSGHIGIDAGDGPAALSNDRINDANWHFVAFTRDTTTGLEQTYVDGILQASVVGDTGLKTSTFRSIGATTIVQLDGVTRVGATYLNARLDDLRIYDRVLSAAEVAGIYAPASSAPAAPVALTASVSGVDVTLNWKDNATNEAGFEVDRATAPSGPFTAIATLPAVATGGAAAYTDSAPAFSTTFYYRVLAFNGFNGGAQSAPSNVASAAIGPASTLRPGQIDPSFGSGGLSVVPSSMTGSILHVQPDGRIYLAHGGDVTRFNANGSVDHTFGANGTLTLSLNVPNPGLGPLAIQPDGKIILTGTTESMPNSLEPGADMVITRFDPDGSPDPTWGRNGTVITDISGRDDAPVALTLLPDGKVLVLAYDYGGIEDPDRVMAVPALLRYNADGSLDSTFGSGGKVRFTLPGLIYSVPSSFAVQPDGQIVVTGTGVAPVPNPSHAWIARFAANGASNFISVNPTVGSSEGTPIPAPDGKLLLLNGSTMTRLNSDFTIDATFGTNGNASVAVGTPGNIDAPTNDSIYGAIVLSDGSILAAGFSQLFPRWRSFTCCQTANSTPTSGRKDACSSTRRGHRPTGRLGFRTANCWFKVATCCCA